MTASNGKRKPFVQVPKIAISSPSLTSGDFRVLCYLLGFYGETYPTYETIVEQTGLAKRTVGKSIKRLKELNIIEYVRGSNLKGRSNVYSIKDEAFWCIKSPKSAGYLGAKSHLDLVQTGHSNKNTINKTAPSKDGRLEIESEVIPSDYLERIEAVRRQMVEPANREVVESMIRRLLPKVTNPSQAHFLGLEPNRQSRWIAVMLQTAFKVWPPDFDGYMKAYGLTWKSMRANKSTLSHVADCVDEMLRRRMAPTG